MNYYVVETDKHKLIQKTAGVKARQDVETIFKWNNFKKIEIPCLIEGRENKTRLGKIKAHYDVYMLWKNALKKIKKNDWIYIQFPLLEHTMLFSLLIKNLEKRGIHTSIIIHDVEAIRFTLRNDVPLSRKIRMRFEEISSFKNCSKIIVHNEKMKSFMHEKWKIHKDKMDILGIFDYLVENYNEELLEKRNLSRKGPVILEVLVVFYHAKYIKDVVAAFGYSTSSIFDIAGKYHVIALFNYNNFIEKAVSASFIYRHGIVWITAYAYVLLYILINNLAVKKKIEIIQIIYLGIYAFDQMLSGGRTALFRMITAILIITVICFGLNKRRNFTKLLFKIVGIIFGIILLLIGINMLLNRTGENSTLNLILESIYVYIGAPIQNLDTYLQGTRHTPELWGSQVFRNIYTYLGGKYGISQYLYQLDLPFLKHNGLNTGNVYTTFYQFYYDFGYDGIVPLMAIIALYFSCAYRKIYNNKPFTIIIYAYLFNDLIMLIFSDRFYETVASIGFVKHLLVTFILYKVLIDKGVALEYRHGIKLKFKRQKKTVIPMGTN